MLWLTVLWENHMINSFCIYLLIQLKFCIKCSVVCLFNFMKIDLLWSVLQNCSVVAFILRSRYVFLVIPGDGNVFIASNLLLAYCFSLVTLNGEKCVCYYENFCLQVRFNSVKFYELQRRTITIINTGQVGNILQLGIAFAIPGNFESFGSAAASCNVLRTTSLDFASKPSSDQNEISNSWLCLPVRQVYLEWQCSMFSLFYLICFFGEHGDQVYERIYMSSGSCVLVSPKEMPVGVA